MSSKSFSKNFLNVAVLCFAFGVLLLATGQLRADTTEPVAAWNFEEGIGTTTADFMGAHNGTLINGPLWVEGKIGSWALSFDGVDDLVSISNASTLNYNTTTISLWVNPNSPFSGTIFRITNSSSNTISRSKYEIRVTPSGITFITGDGSNIADSDVFSASIPSSSWSLVTCSLDASNMKSCYLNGVIIGSVTNSANVSLNTPTSAIIGTNRNLLGNNYFEGSIDDVRIYDRALTASEVEALFTGNTEPPVDTAPPIISQGSPSGTLQASTTSATLSVMTNENAMCKYNLAPDVAYADMSFTFATTGESVHQSPLTDLVDGGTYNYYIKCSDVLENASNSDYAISFSVSSSSVDITSDMVLHLDFNNNIIDNTIPREGISWKVPHYVPGPKSATQPDDFAASVEGAYILVGNNPELYGMANLTYSMWVKKYTLNSGDWMIELPGAYHLNLTKYGKIKARVFNSVPQGSLDVDGIEYNEGKNTDWNHYAVTYDGTTEYILYKNGIRIGSKACIPSNCAGNVSTILNSVVVAGRKPDQYFNGAIDDLRIYRRTLTPAEITLLSSVE